MNILKYLFLGVIFLSADIYCQTVKVDSFKLKSPAYVGTYQSISVYEGSFGSGMTYIPGTDNEFYMMSDRGPNVDASSLNDDNAAAVLPIPSYAPKFIRVKLSGDSIHILQSTTFKRPDGTNVSGIPLPTSLRYSDEEAWSSTSKVAITRDEWGMDPESFRLGNNNDAWVAEEYGPSIWHISLTDGKVIKRYAPFSNGTSTVTFDTIYQKRHPNRGFEGIALTPSGKVYVILESALYNPTGDTGDSSRVIRMLELDTLTNQTHTFVYLHPAKTGDIREKDWKVSDMAAVNDSVFLVEEHAARKSDNYHRLYLININSATPVTQTSFGGKTLEGLKDSAGLAKYGISPVKKTLFLDLVANKWNIGCEKSESIAIVNDSTIVVGNDNDFGITSEDDDGNATANGIQTTVYRYTLPSSMKLNLPKTTGIVASADVPKQLSLSQNYPNPFNPSTTISYCIPAGTLHAVSLRVYDLMGREIAMLVNETKTAGTYSVVWNASHCASGVYFIKMQSGNVTEIKKALLLK
jgi:hypothetical protein